MGTFIGRMVEKFINRKKTCIQHGCAYQQRSFKGDPNLCLICRLPLGVPREKFMATEDYDDLYAHCAPLLGFEREEQVPSKNAVRSHTRGMLNGCWVMVWRVGDIGVEKRWAVEVHAPSDIDPWELFTKSFDGDAYLVLLRSAVDNPLSLFEAKMVATEFSLRLAHDYFRR